MSGVSPDEVHTLELLVASQYESCSILCLIAYEYTITFGREVQCIWARKLTATSLLLLLTRWTMVLSQIWVWIPFLSSRVTCVAYYVVRQLLFFFTYAQVALFSGLRVYALWSGSSLRYWFLFCILMLGFAPVWTNIFRWSRTAIIWEGAPFNTCSVPADLSHEVTNAYVSFVRVHLCYLLNGCNYRMVVFTRSCAIAVDVMVLVLTWIKTFQHWRQSRQVNHTTSVATLLLRDGTLYFLALLAMNVAQIITFSESNETWGNFVDIFLQNTPPILVQRFMLNLREFNKSERAEDNSDPEHFSRFSVSFRVPSDFLGTIGQPLEHSQVPELYGGTDESSTEWSGANIDTMASQPGPSSPCPSKLA
ncbi:hypothetical protein PsYK624_154550 [Phanerochaete sordida]|uniref:DUF6533 domain-containing protein n=1 Tax=Phanerochaete sordida TaxID=48140 RepID=A0A9P3LL53_9APHY|nr:hypothetical protein PsYK624_154550 [Phanerochaete sordida]